jgi:hypothetical protein
MSKTTAAIVVALLLISNVMVYMANVDSRTGAYIRGYAAGQADRANHTYRTYDQWWQAGSEDIEAMNRQAHMQYVHEREQMILHAEARAIADGYGWHTGRAK